MAPRGAAGRRGRDLRIQPVADHVPPSDHSRSAPGSRTAASTACRAWLRVLIANPRGASEDGGCGRSGTEAAARV
jgi:hypothetical protein